MRPPVPVHRLRPNDSVWTPPTVAFLDTETTTVHRERRDIERLRLWACHLTDRRELSNRPRRDVWGDGDTACGLAAWLDQHTRNRSSTWLYCHNLSFDLTTTRLPHQLVALGWQINDAAIGGKAPWLRLARSSRVLTLVDSWSWLPYALGTIGKAVGIVKPELPADDDNREHWLARCRADVAILEAAVLELMSWWDREQLGRWSISGASCGWNAYRHKQPTHLAQTVPLDPWEALPKPRKVASDPVIIDPDPDTVKAERVFVHGGRRGVWRIGEHRGGPYAELDFVAAYPSIAANCPLPAQRTHAFDSLPVSAAEKLTDRWGACARVLVRTDVPRWPVRLGRSTWYPVGEFWADLAGPDISEAARLGCLRAIGPGWVHRLSWNMAPWAEWVLDVQAGTLPDTPEVARLAAKSWGRAVLGKWSARGYERLSLGPAPGSGWSYEEAIDHATGEPGALVDLAGQSLLVTATLTPDNAYPAILAWVEAHVRSRLNLAIDQLGAGAVLQCDTDGLIVREEVVGTPLAGGCLLAPPELPAAGRLAWCLDQLAPLVAPLRLRAKARHEHVTVLGPQHLRLDGERRYSGLPGMATEVAPDTFETKQWPKLSWQLAHGDPSGYVRPLVRSVVKGPWPSGWLLTDGRVVPVRAVVSKAGDTRLLGWNSSPYWQRGLRPADTQHPALAALL